MSARREGNLVRFEPGSYLFAASSPLLQGIPRRLRSRLQADQRGAEW